MPYCDPCDRFYNPNTLTDVGDCPDGHHVKDPVKVEGPRPVPWHFKLLIAFTLVYLGWRLIQLIGWLVG
jgi:hypothetical protein